jgi:hypothetical protein
VSRLSGRFARSTLDTIRSMRRRSVRESRSGSPRHDLDKFSERLGAKFAGKGD